MDEVLGAREGVISTLTCHPKTGEEVTFNQALCALWAAGYGQPAGEPPIVVEEPTPEPRRLGLPAAMRDETGVIFASVFPGGAALAEELERYYQWEKRLNAVTELEDLRRYVHDFEVLAEISRRIGRLRGELAAQPHEFDRRFIFRILAMGHSQFAEYIRARGRE